MTCTVCNNVYTDASLIDDFKDGVCLPCQVQIEEDARDAKERVELRRWNENNGTEYDGYSFWFACEDGYITRPQLRRYPMLRWLFDGAIEMKKRTEAVCKYERERQPELWDARPFENF